MSSTITSSCLRRVRLRQVVYVKYDLCQEVVYVKYNLCQVQLCQVVYVKYNLCQAVYVEYDLTSSCLRRT